MVLGHAELLPDSSSFEVLDSWRSLSSGSARTAISGSATAIGEDLANAHKSERTSECFIVRTSDEGDREEICVDVSDGHFDSFLRVLYV